MEATWTLTSNGDAGTFDCAPTTIVSASRGGIASVVDSTCTCRHKSHCRLMRCMLNFRRQANIPPQVRCSTFLNCAASSGTVYSGIVSFCSAVAYTHVLPKVKHGIQLSLKNHWLHTALP